MTASTVSAAEPNAALRAFAPCDGYGAPATVGDGMTAQAMEMRYFVPSGPNGTTVRSPTLVGTPGVRACDEALAQLSPTLWRRKVSLLQARAVHDLGQGDTQAALADLQRAREAAAEPNDAHFVRSQMLAETFIRAYALRLSGDRKGASAMALQAWAERPYNRQAAAAALATMGEAADPADIETVLRGVARLNPPLTVEAFRNAFEHRRFAEAIDLYPSLAAERTLNDQAPLAQERLKLQLEDRFKAENMWVEEAGPYAYALAAEGRAEDARAALADARARLKKAVEEPPSLPTRRKGKLNSLTPVLIRKTQALEANGTLLLDHWSSLVERRIKIAEGGAAEVLKALEADPLPPEAASTDIADALIAALPEADSPALRDLKKTSRPKPRDNPNDIAALLFNLPEAETRDRGPIFDPTRKMGFWGGPDSYVKQRLPDGSILIDCYGLKATGAATEEVAVLHAAYLARQEGKGGFLIIGRRDVHHVTETYPGDLNPYHAGYETVLQVILVDPKALPKGYEKAGWRVIDAADVLAKLQPAYTPPVQAAAP